MTKWRADVYDSGEAHVRPINDLVSHDADPDCVCRPRPQRDVTDFGDAWTYIHHSLDARERSEA